jgi:hypothetical protein
VSGRVSEVFSGITPPRDFAAMEIYEYTTDGHFPGSCGEVRLL